MTRFVVNCRDWQAVRFRAVLALAVVLLNPLSSLVAGDRVLSKVPQSRGAFDAGIRIIVRARPGSLPRVLVPGARNESSPSPDVLVALRRSQADGARRNLEAFLRSRGQSTARNLEDLWIVNAFALEATPDLVKELQRRGDVEAVYPDRYVKLVPTTSAQPQSPEPPADVAWGVAKTRATEVWEQLKVRGAGATIGHIDTGVDAAHPALAGRILLFKNFINPNLPQPYDDNGHGTHTAGSIVGSANGIGVAPAAKLIVAKALDGNGSGRLSGLLAAMQWMLNPDGMDRPVAVSNSWGGPRNSLYQEEGVFRDAVKAWVDAGIVPLFSSGNSGPNTECVPGAYPESFAVGATDKNDVDADFSSGAESTWDGQTYIRPDLAAPGVVVYSAAPGGYYAWMSGTSMACPHVAGVVALMKSARPSITASEITKILTESGTDLGRPGKDTRFGFGLIDAMKAVTAARSQALSATP
ncbi:MAG: S8 family serine peptidase [Candidatus Wallbacteria bacterium]|nr:S8 family serine peptidase [Candidatus Wallbacteria bacterium]